MATVTISPGRMRMKCLRILPAMCAMISCPLSSLTRNCVLASACMTLPWTWNASSLAIKILCEVEFRCGQTYLLKYTNPPAVTRSLAAERLAFVGDECQKGMLRLGEFL